MSGDADVEVHCRVCGDAVDRESGVACVLCRAPHHQECFDYAGTCSTFGCGGLVHAPWEDLPALSPDRPLEIDRSTRNPLMVREAARGLGRRLRNQAKDLPVTIRTGVVGGLVTMGAYLLLHPAAWTTLTTGVTLAVSMNIVLCAVLHGVMAPFVAPAQHKTPGRIATFAAAGLIPFFLISHAAPPTSGFNPAAIVAIALGMVASTSIAELATRFLSRRGRARGWKTKPVRMVLSWLAFIGLFSVVDFFTHGYMTMNWFLEILILSLMVPIAGVPPLEAGREEYRKRLTAETEEALAEMYRLAEDSGKPPREAAGPEDD